ncbi:hypothetical protein T492DRAFT_836421 [Pavlovales sp. CCMP2436]|nr:hypothetical protein T492DRAFT_836421 [Pavlovales sp. CCMP2436]
MDEEPESGVPGGRKLARARTRVHARAARTCPGLPSTAHSSGAARAMMTPAVPPRGVSSRRTASTCRLRSRAVGRRRAGARAAASGRTRATSPAATSGLLKAGNLARHKCTHSGERSYPCDEPGCEYRAAEAGHLTAHKRTHSGERPGERPYACDEPDCKYRAARVGTLTALKRTHSGELPFACDEPGCDFQAATAGQLERHKSAHSGVEHMIVELN